MPVRPYGTQSQAQRHSHRRHVCGALNLARGEHPEVRSWESVTGVELSGVEWSEAVQLCPPNIHHFRK